MLPNGGDSWAMQNLSVLEDYARKNGESWYRFVNDSEDFRRSVPNGNLGIVTRVVKTTDFGLASFENASHSAGVSFSLKAASIVAGTASASFKWHVSSSIDHRCGPERIPTLGVVSSFNPVAYI